VIHERNLQLGVRLKPLDFQKVGHESEHPRVTWFKCFVMPFGMRKCGSQHVLLH